MQPNNEGNIVGKSSTTTSLPDGSQRIVELTTIRNADGTVTEQKVTRTIVPSAASSKLLAKAVTQTASIKGPQYAKSDGTNNNDYNQQQEDEKAFSADIQDAEEAAKEEVIHNKNAINDDSSFTFESNKTSWTRTRQVMAGSLLLFAILGGVGAAIGIVFSSKSSNTGDGDGNADASSKSSTNDAENDGSVKNNADVTSHVPSYSPTAPLPSSTDSPVFSPGIESVETNAATSTSTPTSLPTTKPPTPKSPTITNPNPSLKPTTTIRPTTLPTPVPTLGPTQTPTKVPIRHVTTEEPTLNPTVKLTTSPTKTPTASPTKAPVEPCYNVSIIVQTDINTGNNSMLDTTIWELYERQSREVMLESGPLESNSVYNSSTCLHSGLYTFNITDYAGDGFGEDCIECGYFIYVDGNFVGGSVSFYDNEELTFPVPFYGDESTANDYEWCTGDFYVAIVTDQWPWETSWELINVDDGELVLSGGPYYNPSAIYTQRSCLPDGKYEFTIYDSESDGMKSPGFYLLYADNQELVSDREISGSFGSLNTTTFVLGAGP